MPEKYFYYFIIAFFFYTHVYPQGGCGLNNIEKAQLYLEGDEYIEPDYYKAFSLLNPCALNGNRVAQNLLGIMYLRGDGVVKDETKGYELIKEAAERRLHPAEYNMGRLYKYGLGCSRD